MESIVTEQYKGLVYQGMDYSDKLEVSNLGNIRNSKNHRIYKTHLNKATGYYGACISLGSRDRKKLFKTHKAVAETFVANPENLPVINHKDGIKTHNYVSNLEWCSTSYNNQHALDIGLVDLNKRRGIRSLTLEEIKYIKKVYIPRDRVFGMRALAKKYEVHHSTIKKALES
ncbi:hypothetical protein [Acetobacterium wieringae]|uniref:hypothetical protein n=1 Tax=Acetobacterium wieringae TaxID=52694 RepID=UPI002B1FB26E|nr:hypothetical protein [Acetobacterium wieringae]MEA4805100.1 hypothetical protein [Acetobacterium wieringae]